MRRSRKELRHRLIALTVVLLMAVQLTGFASIEDSEPVEPETAEAAYDLTEESESDPETGEIGEAETPAEPEEIAEPQETEAPELPQTTDEPEEADESAPDEDEDADAEESDPEAEALDEEPLLDGELLLDGDLELVLLAMPSDSNTEDIGHITYLNVKTLDGKDPWDGDDGRGHDASSTNGRIRAYDVVTYEVEASVQSNDDGVAHEHGRTGYRVVIPDDPELRLDQGAMGWAQNWTETVEGGQRIYTFYRDLPQTNGHAIPGGCTVEVILNVGGKTEGYTIQPTITAWCEGNDTTLTSTPDAVTVTSNAAYNVVLAKGDMSGYVSHDIGGVHYGGYEAALGAAIELRNTDLDKALRGLELADTSKDISFDIDLSVLYTENGATTNITGEYTPQLLVFKGNGENNDYISSLPGARLNVGSMSEDRVCGDTGDVEVTQDGSTLHVTIKGGTYSCDSFPKTSLNGNGQYMLGDKFQEGIFSSYYFKVLLPVEIGDKKLQDANQQFTLQLDATVTNMRVTSVTGQTVTAQSNTNDDSQSVTRFFTGTGGTHDNEIYFSNPSSWTEPFTPGAKGDGTDYATPGTQGAFTVGFSEKMEGADMLARVIAFDQLVKFDDKAISVDPTKVSAADHGNTEGNWQLKVLYAYKADGTGWQAEEELIRTKEEDLVYSESYDPSRVCVGKLYQWRGMNWDSSQSEFSKLAQGYFVIKADAPTNAAYTLTVSSNAWTAGDFLEEVAAANPERSREDITGPALFVFKDYAQANWNLNTTKPATVNVDRDTDAGGYHKAQYNENGYAGGDTAGFLCGDTMYVVPYITRISKAVAQFDGGNRKINYDLDNNQRVADYVVFSEMVFDREVEINDWNTVVTLTDTLPAGLSYISGSSYLGGSYAQSTENPYEEPGTVTGGTVLPPAVTKNADGTTTLVWKYDHAVVNGALPDLHYSCLIGDAGDLANDVHDGDSLTNKVSIVTSDDRRNISKENGNLSEATIHVTKLASFSIFKRVSEEMEADGVGEFYVAVNNTGTTEESNLCAIDLMPRNGLADTVMTGTYRLSWLHIDKDAIGDLSDVQIWYTYAPLSQEEAELATPAEIRMGWHRAEVNAETGEITGGIVGSWPTAIAYLDGSLAPNKAARITMGFAANRGSPNDVMNNSFMVGEKHLHIRETTKIYTRSIDGVAWIDQNGDGVRDSGELLYQNVTATLYRKDGTRVATTQTDENGYYHFGLVNSGDPADTPILHGDEEFYIVFTQPEEGTNFSITSPAASGTDVFGNAGEADKALASTLGRIDNIRMPSIAAMREQGITVYELPNQNIAYLPPYELPSTAGGGTYGFTVLGTAVFCTALSLLAADHKRKPRHVGRTV